MVGNITDNSGNLLNDRALSHSVKKKIGWQLSIEAPVLILVSSEAQMFTLATSIDPSSSFFRTSASQPSD